MTPKKPTHASQPTEPTTGILRPPPTETPDHDMHTRYGPRRDLLVVVRISDSNAFDDLDSKIVETTHLHSSVPGMERLRELKSAPLRDPQSVGATYHTGVAFKAVVFRIPGTRTYVLMALGSATKFDASADDNQFVQLLAATLQDLKVGPLYVADFARLLRSIDHLSGTWRAVRTGCRTVHHAGSVIDTRAATAEMQFMFEAMGAAGEARAIVRRTWLGKMKAALQGRVPLAEDQLPRGWTFDDQGQVILDPSVSPDQIREIVRALGDPELSHDGRASRAANAGAISAIVSRRNGEQTRVDELSNPADLVRKWYGLLDVWRTGEWTVDWSLPVLLEDMTFDLPVHILDGEHGPTWRTTWTLPLPQDGFADDAEFEAAAELQEERTLRTGGANTVKGQVRKALAGFPSWEYEDTQYALLTGQGDQYELHARPLAAATKEVISGGVKTRTPRGWGRRPARDRTIIARFSSAELHRAIASSVVDALGQGAAILDRAEHLHDRSGVASELRAELDELRRHARNARRSSVEAATECDRDAFRRDVDRIGRRIDEVQRQLLRAVGEGDGEFEARVGTLVQALVTLMDEPGPVDAEIAAALRTVFSDLRVRLIDDRRAEWSVTVRLPMGGGQVAVGPIEGTVDVGLTRQLQRERRKSLHSNGVHAAELFMDRGLTIEQVGAHFGTVVVKRVREHVRARLKELGLSSVAAQIMVVDTPPETRQVIWAMLHGRTFPPGISRPFAAHVAAAFLPGRDLRPTAHTYKTQVNIQRLIDEVRLRGGWVPDEQRRDVCDALGIQEATLAAYLRGQTRQHGGSVPRALLESDGGFGLRACPRLGCPGELTVVRIRPDVPGGLLCPACRRAPAAPDVLFPTEYLSDPRDG